MIDNVRENLRNINDRIKKCINYISVKIVLVYNGSS